MGDDAKDIADPAENKASAEALDRARLARERREAEQKKRLEELRAHAAAAQAQQEKRDEERRRRMAEQRSKDDDRRSQVEERKRAINEASVSRREALLQRERERTERLDRTRATRSASRTGFAFGSSTPRLLDPPDTPGFFWATRSTNPVDQINFFDSMAASTTNVMVASSLLTRGASALHLDSDEAERHVQPVMWSSVARRRTDLVPTLPLPRAPGRAYSMTRLDRITQQRPLHSASPSMHHLNRTLTPSGETTLGSRPGSAMSNATGVVRRAMPAQRKPRPSSIAGTGVNTPSGGGDTNALSAATTPSVSRDGTLVQPVADVPRRPQNVPRRPRPMSVQLGSTKTALPRNPADGKPPLHRKPKPSKENDKTLHGKSMSPGRSLSPSPALSKEPSVDKDIGKTKQNVDKATDKNQESALFEVTQKLEALQMQGGEETHYNPNIDDKISDNVQDKLDIKPEQNPIQADPMENLTEFQKSTEVPKIMGNNPGEVKEEKMTDDSEMTASMTRRITTEEQAKAALAERRRRAREELEKQAELERQRLEREAEEEAEKLRLEEEKQRRDEEEARELARLQRQLEEEKLKKAIEAQQQLEREEAIRKVRDEAERQARLKEEEEKRKAAEEAEKLRKEEAEREEKERQVRKQRVEAIMSRTRLRKAKEEKEQQENKGPQSETPQIAAASTAPSTPAQPEVTQSDNGNTVATDDLLGFGTSQAEETRAPVEATTLQMYNAAPAPTVEAQPTPNNGNFTAGLLDLSEQINNEDRVQVQNPTSNKQQAVDNLPNANIPSLETNNGNVQHLEPTTNVSHISANFIETERMSAEHSQTKVAENVPQLIEDDFTAHNGHGTTHNHPLTLQNAI